MNNINTPKDLLEYMKSNMKYGWIGFDGSIHVENLKDFRKLYRVASLNQIMETKLVTCVEAALFIKKWLENNKVECKIYCHRSYENEDNFDNEVKMHIIILYKELDKWIHFEYTNRPEQGLHEYDSIEKALSTITEPFAKNSDVRILTEIKDIQCGLSFKELNNYVNSFEEIIIGDL